MYLWTDNPIPLTNTIKYTYITELRERVNIEKVRRDTSPKVWTDINLDNTIHNETVHIIELREETDAMCNSHVPAEKIADFDNYDNSKDTTYQAIEDITYQSDAETGLCSIENSSKLSTHQSVNHPSQVTGCTSHDISADASVCTMYDHGRDLTHCSNADAYDDHVAYWHAYSFNFEGDNTGQNETIDYRSCERHCPSIESYEYY